MNEPNETSPFVCKFLNDESFALAHSKFVEAFSDYFISFQLPEQQFRNHIILNAVDLNRSIGCFDKEQLVGISLNGFGTWEGLRTVYDAGTGVIPSHRRRGISEAMFNKMLPIFTEQGFEQCLLEVIIQNHAAICLYEKLGFEKSRKLLLMEATELNELPEAPRNIELRDIQGPDLGSLRTIADGQPSWQNSFEAIERSLAIKRIIGAFEGTELLGYIIFSAGLGRVSQLAVHPAHRRRGIAGALVAEMKADTIPGSVFQVINIDAGVTAAVEFFRRCGFETTIAQYEMRKML
jgi:ribosomal protein S18 acetylase RimI-like enzyme